MPPNITSTTSTVGMDAVVTTDDIEFDSSSNNDHDGHQTDGLKHRGTSSVQQPTDNTSDNSCGSISSNGIIDNSMDFSNIEDDTKDIKILNNVDKASNTNLNNNNTNVINNNNYTKSHTNATVTATEFKPEIRWPDLMVQIFLHAGFVYGLFYLLTFNAKFYTYIWSFVMFLTSGFGITAGAHRLWSHKSYKAKWPLRSLLIFFFTIAGQRDAYTWAHDHRVHHKYTETEADPHNAKRGFFFAHIAWLFLTPHPEVVAKRKIIDMSDLEADPIVMWQKKYYIPLFALLAIALPVLVPVYFWNESLWVSFWVCFNFRFCCTLNVAFFVNSVAHMYGNRPYDKRISPVESLPVAIAALGEGWHNYHHVFPWDYKTGEFGEYKFNITTAFIDFFSKVGWATDRKYVSADMIARRALKCGDGTHFLNDENAHKNPLWGYGDKDIPKEDIAELNKMKI